MSDWDPQAYLRFANERTQPSIDLTSRIHSMRRRKSSTSAAVPATARRSCGGAGPGAISSAWIILRL